MGATDDSFTLSLQSTESNVKQTNRPMIQSDSSIPFFLLFLSGFIFFYFLAHDFSNDEPLVATADADALNGPSKRVNICLRCAVG